DVLQGGRSDALSGDERSRVPDPVSLTERIPATQVARYMTIAFSDVLAAPERIKPYLVPTPLRNYPELDELVGHGIQVWVKHENHQPTQSFKIRNALSAITALSAEARARGVIGASTGNHGLGLAYAG